MKSEKQQMTEGIELPNQEENQNARRKRNLQILGNIGNGHKLHSRNLIKAINTWAVPLIRHSGPFLKWMKEELQQMDKRTGKLMMYTSKR